MAARSAMRPGPSRDGPADQTLRRIYDPGEEDATQQHGAGKYERRLETAQWTPKRVEADDPESRTLADGASDVAESKAKCVTASATMCTSGSLTPQETTEAARRITQSVQQAASPCEVSRLTKGQPAPSHRPRAILRPMLRGGTTWDEQALGTGTKDSRDAILPWKKMNVTSMITFFAILWVIVSYSHQNAAVKEADAKLSHGSLLHCMLLQHDAVFVDMTMRLELPPDDGQGIDLKCWRSLDVGLKDPRVDGVPMIKIQM